MQYMQIHHIGYLVKKIDRAIIAFEELGYRKETEIIFDEHRGIDICFLVKDGYRMELVSPKSKESVVYELQKKYGNSPYHICYNCENIEMSIQELRSNGYVQYDIPHEAIALNNRNVCFLIHPYLGMIELLEDNKHELL